MSLEISSNENLLTKCQTSKPSPQRQGLMTELRLGDVRLNELASWLGARTPKSPGEAVSMFNKGWQWYYRKYIDVQKGGIGGIAMLIGSYCVLSYIWSYPHIKKQRWRKYH
ncbi:ATP synthase subunit f, mitochondrial isoform X2 [Pangasianodon hypophthalmus]|uniref:ATP synthase subunit f, mitochondrial isoform X2 n=1 Tax=Pangasianodon hypophthalmus TaxID=310915 RepID=UPI00147CE841|nr:ATP synthase subunit f, mitochondrial isoform X2 [Pangasianodon hypophthalmus]